MGTVFAGLVQAVDREGAKRLAGLGLGWGVATWLVLAAVVMPLWLSAVGSPASPPFPNFAVPSVLWHAVYGIVLGGVYAVTQDSL